MALPEGAEARAHCAGRVNDQIEPPAWFYQTHSANFVVVKKSGEKVEAESSAPEKRPSGQAPPARGSVQQAPPARGSVEDSVAQAHLRNTKALQNIQEDTPMGVWVDTPFTEDNATRAPHLSPRQR